MILRNDIEQGSLDWFLIRRGKIGGTLSKGLFVDSDTLLINLLAEITEPYDEEESFSSAVMEEGKEKEPDARVFAEKKLGVQFMQVGWLQSDINILGISPDGITEDLKESLEIKCPQPAKHIKTLLSQEIPADNIHQCIHYFTVNPHLEKHHFLSFRPESISDHFLKTITRDCMVNIGTEKTKKMIKVSDAVEKALESAEKIENRINEIITQLTF